ncbi:MAG: zinc-ribbon domain-containing protein [Patescibacteria group bacterium]|jgi:hypothetical protein
MTGSSHPTVAERTFADKFITCIDCKEEFAFTVSAQEYFAEKGFTGDPKRCRTCYAAYKQQHPKGSSKTMKGPFTVPPGGEHLLNLDFE